MVMAIQRKKTNSPCDDRGSLLMSLNTCSVNEPFFLKVVTSSTEGRLWGEKLEACCCFRRAPARASFRTARSGL